MIHVTNYLIPILFRYLMQVTLFKLHVDQYQQQFETNGQNYPNLIKKGMDLLFDIF